MKIQYLAEIISEFSGFHHTPSFKASRSTGDFAYSSTKNSRRASTDSNHSIHIPIGVMFKSLLFLVLAFFVCFGEMALPKNMIGGPTPFPTDNFAGPIPTESLLESKFQEGSPLPTDNFE
uniref:Encoded peptide n=1 Tax=Caenorhabditis tropicalis TaxID=1561998 RepID=A0A1I7THB7_9PELO